MPDSILGAGALVVATKKKNQTHKNHHPSPHKTYILLGHTKIQENVIISHTEEGLSCSLKQHKKVTAWNKTVWQIVKLTMAHTGLLFDYNPWHHLCVCVGGRMRFPDLLESYNA